MKLKQYLELSGITVTDFAQKVGVSSEAIRLYLLGKRRPRIDTVSEISRVTNGAVSGADFYEPIPQEKKPAAPTAPPRAVVVPLKQKATTEPPAEPERRIRKITDDPATASSDARDARLNFRKRARR